MSSVPASPGGFAPEGALSFGIGNPNGQRPGLVGDAYFRRDGGAGAWLYKCTVAGDAATATWVAQL